MDVYESDVLRVVQEPQWHLNCLSTLSFSASTPLLWHCLLRPRPLAMRFPPETPLAMQFQLDFSAGQPPQLRSQVHQALGHGPNFQIGVRFHDGDERGTEN